MEYKLTYKYFFFILSLSLIALACSKHNLPKSTSEDENKFVDEIKISKAALTVSDSVVSVNELENTLLGYAFEDSLTLDSSIKDYVYKLQLYKEAESRGFDEDQTILDEIETYKRLLAEESLRDSSLLAKMIVEAYNHMQIELNASHLFISLPSDALPKDTLFVYKELIRIRNEAISTSKFDSLVNLYSQDRRTNKIGGSLGWFSALQMVYPIEKAAYNLEVGQISYPIRSGQGYHLIRLDDKRPSRGAVQVRHLLKSLPSNADSTKVQVQYSAIDSLLTLARQDPGSFTQLIIDNSDDFNSRENEGLLPIISTGSRVEKVFEDAAFELDSGDVSDIVKSTVGFHIIQGVGKKAIGSLEENFEYIKQKTLTDSRGDFLEQASLDKAVGILNFEELLSIPEDIALLFNKSLLNSEWQYAKPEKQQNLFKFNGGTVSLSSFLRYVEDRQAYDPIEDNMSIDMAIFKYYGNFKKETLKKLAIENTFKTSESLKTQLNLIKKDLVCTKYYNQTVLEKAVADTIGQRRWYENNLSQFKKSERAYATIVESRSENSADTLLSIFDQNPPYRLKRGIKPVYFTKNFYFLNDDDKRRLTGLFAIMQKNDNYIVEIGGHRDVAEEGYVSSSRLNEVVQYLRGLGLEITRIKETDYGQTRLADRFDWNQNQRVSIQFFSNDYLDLLPSLQASNNDIVKVQRKWFSIEEAPYLWQHIGKSFVNTTDSTFAFVHVKRVEDPGYFSLREVRGRVINEYQKSLENDLKKKLELKYPVKLNEDEINRLKKSLLKKI